MSETPAPPEEPLDRIATALRDAFCLGVKDQALVLIDKVNAQLPAARAELAALYVALKRADKDLKRLTNDWPKKRDHAFNRVTHIHERIRAAIGDDLLNDRDALLTELAALRADQSLSYSERRDMEETIARLRAELELALIESLRAELEAVKGEHKESQGANRYLLNEATALRARLAAAERMAEAAERLPWSEQNPDFSTALAAFRDLT